MAVATSTQFDRLGLEELRTEAIRAIVGGLLVVAWGVFLLIASGPGHWRLEPLPVLAGLIATAATTYWLLGWGVAPAAVVLLAGLFLTITLAISSFGDGLLATAYPFLPIVAGILLGWRAATAVALAACGLVLGFAAQSPDVLPASTAQWTLALTAVELGLSFLLSRPIEVALGWAWSSSSQALAKTDEARARQAEAIKLSTALEQACDRLETANAELERARRAAVEARELKAQFATTISHELRTPLNLIIGFSEMMVMNPEAYGAASLAPAHRGDVEAIYRNAGHLSTLIDDILDLSKIEVHRMGLQREVLRVAQVVEEAVSAIQTLFQDKGLSLEVRLPLDLPDLYADRTRVRQILINLLNNAARHTSHGGATVGGAADEREVVVWVTDTGTGIPADDLPHVFDEFYQIAGPNWRRTTGLGLTISKRFVELHGGSMWVESRPGEGSTFYFSLPLAANVVAVPAHDDWQTWVVSPETGQALGTVAVLDDDPEVVQLFQRYLDRYRVIGTPSLAKARQLACARPLHALVIANGVESDPMPEDAFTTIPVVRCPLRSGRTISRSLGVMQYLSKPISRQQVRSVLLRLGRGVRDILIVDDDPEMVRLLARMVQSGHRARDRYSVRTTTDGREALQAMGDRRPDLVLLDLLMPGLDGYGVLDKMRVDERLRDVPVVLITAKGIDESMVASELRISRVGGLPVGEMIRCLEASLGVLLGTPTEHNAPTPTGDPGE